MMSEKIYSMVGISMIPTLVEPMILETEPTDFYNIGDVVVFINRNGKTIVHRIVKHTVSGFTTRGDNNLSDDEPIVKEDILGKVVAAYRGEKIYPVNGGKYGFLLHRYLQIRKIFLGYFIKLLSFSYHLLSGSGFFVKLLPQKYKPRIIQYQNSHSHVYIGHILAGRYDVRRRCWKIFRPWRIFIDEKTLSETKEVLLDPWKECLQSISRIMDSENTLIPVLTQEAWNELFKLADKHGVACYLYYALKQKKAEDIIPSDWQRKIRIQLMLFSIGNLKHLDELEELSLLFEKNGISVVYLKGSHLAFHVYPSPSLRPMGDIDIVASEDDIPKIIGMLFESGYQSDYFSFKYTKDYHLHFPPFNKNGKKSIELHWTLVNPEAHNAETQKIMEWLFNETERKLFGKGTALVFKPDAMVFQLMLHIGLNDNLRPSLKNLLDITVLIQKYQQEINWEVISGIILKTGFVHRLALVGWLAKNSVGAKIPDQFLQSLNAEPSQEVKEIALNRIIHFRDLPLLNNVPSLLKVNMFQKLIILFKSIFVHPSKMKYKYNLRTNWVAFFYYPKWIFKIIRMRRTDILKIFNPDNELIAKSKDEMTLRMWLDEGDYKH